MQKHAKINMLMLTLLSANRLFNRAITEYRIMALNELHLV